MAAVTGGRRYRLFLAGQAVSLLGDGLAILAIPLLVLQMTRSPLAAALASAPRTIGYLLVGLPAGPLVDRMDPWRVLIGADVVRCAVFVALFTLTRAHAGTIAVILVLAFVAGAAGVFFETALAIATRDLYRGQALVGANSFLETANQTSLVIGPAIVGLLAVALGMNAALLVDAATFVVSLTTLAGTRRRTPPIPRPPRQQVPLRTQWRDGVRCLASSPVILSFAVLQVVINLCLAVEKLIVFFARDYLGAASWLVGVAVAGGGLGGVAGAAIAPYLTARIAPVRLALAASAMIGIGLCVTGSAPDAWWLAAGNAVLVWATVVASIVIRTLRQHLVPRDLLGRVTSTVRSIVLATTPLGAVLAGMVTQMLSGNPRLVFLGAGMVVAASAPIAWLSGLRHHDATGLDTASDAAC
ncbi:MFS transporter [Actinoallomurus sp. CA-150999]|uniref:MFS transporter n=1 Tax=Actinoallomurus sp. CA-150999 TaxID=3239887 RepID=UPI003D89C6FF